MEAAAIIGCGHGPVERMAREGVIERRPGPRGVPSLNRASVGAAGEIWRREQSEREAARRASTRRHNDPPDDGQVWVSTDLAALALDVTANRIRQLVQVGRLPATMCGTKLWLRRDDVERAAAARAFARRADVR
ncbi:hypothetical protein [Nocardioides pinisoli]|uniref:Helix-turn-helix domain-containing protein n=1 Tax=Nocardioides pinisoli TaxID=2950279 RepID=A0ABT1KRH9_9ACTN|nr:hypothetical protein [Nocardioides pinisoli]MCP3420350.1 hypothetical protein [Nocardioides pinisoli]